MNVEHYNYTPHPKDFLLPNPCFACAFWVSATVRMVQRWSGLQQDAMSAVRAQLPTVTIRYHICKWLWHASECLPIVTMIVHVMAAVVWLVRFWTAATYHLLPFVTRWPIWLDPAREKGLPAPPPPVMVIDNTHTYRHMWVEWVGWHTQNTVAHRRTVGLVTRLLERWSRWLSDSKFFPGAQASKMNSMVVKLVGQW